MPIEIRPDDVTGEAVIELLRVHGQAMLAASPAESCHFLPAEGLRAPGVSFWAMWDGEELVGCGALKDLGGGEGEIKSMHTRAAQRGKGLGKQMLRHIIEEARSRGMKTLLLETGSMDAFAPARRLYEEAGFTYCDPFGDYVLDPNSAFMRREIA